MVEVGLRNRKVASLGSGKKEVLAGIEDFKASCALRTEGLIGGLANSGFFFFFIQGNNNPQSIIFLELNLGSQENELEVQRFPT